MDNKTHKMIDLVYKTDYIGNSSSNGKFTFTNMVVNPFLRARETKLILDNTFEIMGLLSFHSFNNFL